MRKFWKSFFLLLLAVAFLSGLTACGQGLEGNKMDNFTPIIDAEGADPYIYQEAQTYYYTKTSADNSVTLWRSKNLTTVAAGESKKIWTPSSGYGNVWAPEIYHIQGVWYIYFALDKANAEIHQMYVLSNPSADPYKGAWTFSLVKGMDGKFAIDGTVLRVADKSYFIWSGWAGQENVAQNLYLSEMLSPTEIKAEKILISKPHYPWELMESPVINEGPEAIVHGSTINLTYSASGSWTNDYCLGLLTADVSSDLKDPKSWTKAPEPIFSSTLQTFGPGHNGFAKSEDGKENWLIYHSARWDGAGWSRSVRLQPFSFDSAGKITLKAPLNAESLQKLPSGEAERLRIEASSGQISGKLKMVSDKNSLSKKVVVGFEEKSDRLSFCLNLPKGNYVLQIFVKSSSEFSADSTDSLTATLNGYSEDLTLASSQYYQPLQFKTNLTGKDKLSLSSSLGGSRLSIDHIDLIRQE